MHDLTSPTTKQLFLAPKQVSETYGIPLKTLEVWRYRGTGPKFHKFGRLVRYAIADLAAYEQSSAHTNTSD